MPIVSSVHDETRSCVCIFSAEPESIRTISRSSTCASCRAGIAICSGTYIRGFDQNRCKSLVSAETKNKLIGWVDSEFGSDPDTLKSMTGYLVSLNGGAISWRSSRQGGVK